MIFWSTTLADDMFPEPAVPGTSRNHRIWYVTTRDFRTLSEARVLFDPGHSCIDACLLRDDSGHYLFFKNERANDESVAVFDPRYQNIRMARGERTIDISFSPGRGPDGLWWSFGSCGGRPAGRGRGSAPSTLPASGGEARGGGLPRSGRHTPAGDSLPQPAGAGYGERGLSAAMVSMSRPS